jgi:hypothetical protein
LGVTDTGNPIQEKQWRNQFDADSDPPIEDEMFEEVAAGFAGTIKFIKPKFVTGARIAINSSGMVNDGYQIR